jgi:predicted nucleic acid-binding Zn ribbon protein
MSELRPIADDVRRLGRVPAVDPVVDAARVVWRSAVGEQVARHSLPVRRSGGALVVNCADAGWVSELTLLSRQVQTALGEALGEPSPPLRFAVGNVDAPDPGGAPAAASRPLPPAPSADDRRQASELAAGIADPALRAAAERAIAAGLARRS